MSNTKLTHPEHCHYLDQSAEEMKNYLENIIALSAGNLYWKDKNGVYLGCNNNMAKMVGLPPQEIIGKTDDDLVWKYAADTLRKNDQLVMKTGKSQQFEETGKLANGTYITTISNKVPLYDEQGKIIGILGTSIDITEQKNLEKKLKEAEEQNEKLLSELHKKITGQENQPANSIATYAENITHYLENIIALSPGNLYWKDRNGVYLGCNNNMAKMVGMPRQEIVGKTDYDLSWKEFADVLKENDRLVIETGETQEFEEKAKLSNGEYIIAITNKVPLYDEQGKIIGILGTSIDITEQKKLQQQLHEAELHARAQEERIDTIKAVGASIAHELRTPLRAILNNAQIKKWMPILIDGYEKAKKAGLDVKLIRQSHLEVIGESLADIEHEATYANSVIDMLLINIREMENIQDSFKPLSITEAINAALERYPFNSRDQAALVHVDTQNDFIIQSDERLITQLILNLLNNSLFFIAKARKGEVNIWLEKGEKINTLYFEDTAQGIQEEDLPRIFEAFFTKREMGTGLGLSFSKTAMKEMGGDIVCESEYGKFARFILTFPVVKL